MCRGVRVARLGGDTRLDATGPAGHPGSAATRGRARPADLFKAGRVACAGAAAARAYSKRTQWP